MYSAEWISSINCPGKFSLGFTFPFVNDEDLRKHVLHEVHVHLVAGVFYLFLKHYISNFYISVESF